MKFHQGVSGTNAIYLILTVKIFMGITSLEERYQSIRSNFPDIHIRLIHCVNRTALIQSEMRTILNSVTPHICAICENKCCEGFPLEGWFSLEDYTLYRIKYGKPVLPVNRTGRATACYFLTPQGCSLPEDMRPFTCVKINCKQISEVLRTLGKDQQFKQLQDDLDRIHREVSQSINSVNSSSPTCPAAAITETASHNKTLF